MDGVVVDVAERPEIFDRVRPLVLVRGQMVQLEELPGIAHLNLSVGPTARRAGEAVASEDCNTHVVGDLAIVNLGLFILIENVGADR